MRSLFYPIQISFLILTAIPTTFAKTAGPQGRNPRINFQDGAITAEFMSNQSPGHSVEMRYSTKTYRANFYECKSDRTPKCRPILGNEAGYPVENLGVERAQIQIDSQLRRFSLIVPAVAAGIAAAPAALPAAAETAFGTYIGILSARVFGVFSIMRKVPALKRTAEALHLVATDKALPAFPSMIGLGNRLYGAGKAAYQELTAEEVHKELLLAERLDVENRKRHGVVYIPESVDEFKANLERVLKDVPKELPRTPKTGNYYEAKVGPLHQSVGRPGRR